jgi:hypothetical protein
MKNLKELTGVKVLSKNEQKAITGGYACLDPDYSCPEGSYCCLRLLRCKPDGQSC